MTYKATYLSGRRRTTLYRLEKAPSGKLTPTPKKQKKPFQQKTLRNVPGIDWTGHEDIAKVDRGHVLRDHNGKAVPRPRED
jgi:hypothetical protein